VTKIHFADGVLCIAPGGSGSVWKYSEALVRWPGVSGRIACGIQTELHFTDVWKCTCRAGWCKLRRRNGASVEVHLDTVIVQVWRCTCRP
jgi:hypothetical protein